MTLVGKANLSLTDTAEGMVNKEANVKELRSFGLLVGTIFCILGLWPMLFRGQAPRMLVFLVGGSLMVLGGLVPHVLSPVHKVWMWIGHLLGWINTRVLLGIVFYGLITPIGIVLHMMGKSTIQRGFSDKQKTYRVVRIPRPRAHMKNQF